LRINCFIARNPQIGNPKSEIRNPKSAMSRRIDGPRRRPGVAAGDAPHRLPPSADHTVAGDHRFRITAARRREAASQADSCRDWRAGALVDADRSERERLGEARERGDRDRARGDDDNCPRSGPRTRSVLE
jgi:hypothetical protein